MADQSALSLYELIGAPLHALVDAERQAANATRDFIESIGFVKGEATTPAGETPETEQLGKLRMVSFRHERRAADGTPRSYRIDVPLLSLLPIPALQIKDAELEYLVKIIDTQPMTKKEAKDKLPSPERIDLKATLGKSYSDTSTSRQQALDMQIKIRIRVEQADIPAGLDKMFNLMAENVSSVPEETK